MPKMAEKEFECLKAKAENAVEHLIDVTIPSIVEMDTSDYTITATFKSSW